ncbi:uncharacterized protein LOC122392210 [Amphibalanus amphitrite]|uniref:uncharacterized protein LOC122392210 n=1 Tax=Amphibalanus amphitrite TaxID=1232801 RepID=UPI001C910728|nr:uncharacterized protein LOC122392210 [Amphibalanus amphitrite]XP_043242758.1 uncharacterized protein LOC122392210 [Amphibalanus amphitrite]XP_043242759.1 uncharacterized protein LOC122392210 [Amphibalanus amphitrite]
MMKLEPGITDAGSLEQLPGISQLNSSSLELELHDVKQEPLDEAVPDVAAGFVLRDEDGNEHQLDVVTAAVASDDPFLCLDFIPEPDPASEPEPEDAADSPGPGERDGEPGGSENTPTDRPSSAERPSAGERTRAGAGKAKSGAKRTTKKRSSAQRDAEKRPKPTRRCACLYCGAEVFKISRHLARRHSKEKEVIDALKYPKYSKERKELWLSVVKRGNFQHNVKVMAAGKGEIIPVKRKWKRNYTVQKDECARNDEYASCDQCFGFYLRSTLLLHKMRVHGMEHPQQQRLCESPASVSLDELLASMETDSVGVACKTDMLILKFGAKVLSKLGPLAIDKAKICRRMRELGEVLVEVRKRREGVSLQSCLGPTRFKELTSAVWRLARRRGIGHNARAFARTVGKSLSSCARILITLAKTAEDAKLEQEAVGFLDLYESQWRVMTGVITEESLGKSGSVTGNSPRLGTSERDGRRRSSLRHQQLTEKVSASHGATTSERTEVARAETRGYVPDRRSLIPDNQRINHEQVGGHRGSDGQPVDQHFKRTEHPESGIERTATEAPQNSASTPGGQSKNLNQPERQRLESPQHPAVNTGRQTSSSLFQDIPRGSEEHLQDNARAERERTALDKSDSTTAGEHTPFAPREGALRHHPGTKRRRSPVGRPNYKRRPWSQEEKEAVERRMNWFVRKLVVPGLDYCRAALKEEPVLSSRTWRDVKYCVYNMIQRRKRHGDCAEDSD